MRARLWVGLIAAVCLIGNVQPIQQIPLPVPVSLGGTGNTGASYTSTNLTQSNITCSTGSITTATGTVRYRTIGKTAFINIDFTISSLGTCATNIYVQASVWSGNSPQVAFGPIPGFDVSASTSFVGELESGSPGLIVLLVTPAAHHYNVNGTFETQ